MEEKINNDEIKENKKDTDEHYFQLWKSYEDVAMHFNDLIIRLRIQSIGGVAALAAILGIFLNDKSGNADNPFNYCISSVALLVLMLFWVSIFILDIFYYNRLLEGAVNAILELEQKKEGFKIEKNINLSTNIERAFRTRFKHEPKGWKMILNGRILFYGIVFIALLITFIISFSMIDKCDKQEEKTKNTAQIKEEEYQHKQWQLRIV